MRQGWQSVGPDSEGQGLLMTMSLEEWLQASQDLNQREGVLIPGKPRSRDWEEATLNRLEAALLAEYQTYEDVPEEVRREIQLFLRNGLIERFGGSWTDLSEFEINGSDDGEHFGVAYPDLEHIDVCPGMVSVPFILRSGTHWASLFASNQLLLASR